MINRYLPLAVALGAAVTLNACGGGGGGSTGGLVPSQPGSPTTAPSSSPSSTPTATFVINVPSATAASSAKKRPQFDSPNTGSVRIALQSANGQPNTSISVVAAVGTGAAGCAATSTGQACTVKVGGVAGSDIYTVSTYQSNDGSGPVLATTSIGVSVSATSSSPTQVSLGGVPARVSFSPAKLPLANDGSIHRVAVTVNAADASGAPIVGTTAYQSAVSLQIQNDPAHALTLSTATVTQPGTVVTVTYDSSKPLQQGQIVASDAGMQGATLLAAPLTVNQTSLTLFDDGSNPTGVQVTEAGFTGTFTSTLSDTTVANATLVNGTAGSGNAVVNVTPKSGVRFNTTTLTVGDGNVSVTIPIAVVPRGGKYTAFGAAHTMLAPLGLVKGPDGRLWSADIPSGSMFAFNTTTQAYQKYFVDPNFQGPSQFAFDSAGNVWFADETQIGELNPSTSAVTMFSTGLSASPNILDVIAGPSGSNTMYFFDIGANLPNRAAQPTYIGSINTTNGQITEYQTPNNARPVQALPVPVSMILGPDNAVWLADGGHFDVVRFDTSAHTFSQYAVSNPAYPSQMPEQLASGADGNIWFTSADEENAGLALIGTVNLKNKSVQTFPGIVGGYDWSLVPASDGNLWLTEQKAVAGGLDTFMTIGVIKPAIRTANGAPSVAYYQYPDGLIPQFSVISNLLDGGNGTLWTVDTSNGQFGEVTFK